MNQITSCPNCTATVDLHADDASPPAAFCSHCDWPLAWPVDEPVVPGRAAATSNGVFDVPPRGVDVFAWEREPRTGQRSCWNCSEPNARTATKCVLCGEPLDGADPTEPVARPRPDACAGQDVRNLISVPGPVLIALGLVLVGMIVAYALMVSL